MNQLLSKYDRYMMLKIYSDNQGTRNLYQLTALTHNDKIFQSNYIDAGFDILVPENTLCISGQVNKIDFDIKCSAQIVTDNNKIYNTGFYMYPRSSISKTNLRLANSVGIIDSGYRGNLIGAFDAIEDCSIVKHNKLVQICAPSLMPIVVQIVENLKDLGEKTERGSGGFGSTGF